MFVYYDTIPNKAIIQWGTMVNGDHLDERVGIDWLANYIQVTLWNVLYQTPTKIPQTDAGTAVLATACKGCLVTAVNNGLLAPGVWQGPPLGNVNTGDTLDTGYYIYYPLWATLSQTYRATRAAPPLQILCKFAGAVETINVQMTFER